MGQRKRVKFFSTFKLERMRHLGSALRKYDIDLEVIALPSRKPSALLSLFLAQPRDQIFLTHDWLTIPFLMSWVKQLRGNPYILVATSLTIRARELHPHYQLLKPAYGFAFARALKHSHALICNSQYLCRTLCQDYPWLTGKSYAIYNGIEIPEQQNNDRFIYPAKQNFLTITNFEFNYKYAGLELIREAIKRLRLPEPRLYILGKTLTEKGSQNIQQFAQQVSDDPDLKTEIFPNANVFRFFQPDQAIFVYCSGPEGDSLPRAILEAQAMGMPTVVVNGTGCAEAVVPASSAIVVNPDPASLAEGLVRIMNSDQASMGIAAKLNIAKNFSWEKMAEGYAEVIHSIR